ncbi:hypothetical protein TSUD_292320 [Trifolium subterraneum]|uniref:Uncharacterized protein n=1 Tax=Trifolium subterraneum TaxID=3900 RepID=A0A2Z6MKS0_TRISU|nr:hypothetical protein TSUD_292320 [Trifolium subterraneum]
MFRGGLRPPDAGWVRLNTDGAAKGKLRAGCGVYEEVVVGSGCMDSHIMLVGAVRWSESYGEFSKV